MDQPPGTLIAARRIADDPKAAFRAVSGLVLALFITTVAVVAITTQDAKDLTRFGSVTESHVLTDQVSVSRGAAQNVGPGATRARRPGAGRTAAPLAAQLSAIHGVQGALVVRADPGLTIPGSSRTSAATGRHVQPGPGRRRLVRAARERPRPRPLPGRGGDGGVPGGRVQRPACP